MKHYNCIGLHQRECPEKVTKTRFISVLAVNKCNIERGSVVIGERREWIRQKSSAFRSLYRSGLVRPASTGS